MTASTNPDDPDSDLPDLAAISRLYRRGDVSSPEILDARVRAHARATIQRQRRARTSRWAAAASVVLVIGLTWRILDTPDARPAMAPAAPPTANRPDLAMAQPAGPPAPPAAPPPESVREATGGPEPETDRARNSARVAAMAVAPAVPPEAKAPVPPAATMQSPAAAADLGYRSSQPRVASGAASAPREEPVGPPTPASALQTLAAKTTRQAPAAAPVSADAPRIQALLARIEALPPDTRIGRGEERLTPGDWAHSLRLQIEAGAAPATLAQLYQLAEPYDLYFADQHMRTATGWLDAQQAILSAEPKTP